MKVTTDANFAPDPNCKEVFIFQRNLMLVVDEKDALAFTNKDVMYEVLSYLLNIPSEVYKTIHFEFKYINRGSLTRKELDLMYILIQNERYLQKSFERLYHLWGNRKYKDAKIMKYSL